MAKRSIALGISIRLIGNSDKVELVSETENPVFSGGVFCFRGSLSAPRYSLIDVSLETCKIGNQKCNTGQCGGTGPAGDPAKDPVAVKGQLEILFL